MFGLSKFALLAALVAPSALVAALPSPQSEAELAPGASTFWMETIKRQGTVGYGDSAHKVFRNVKDFGATGDGTTDDTEAINSAISDGNRCGQGCDSATITPAIIYFPAGTYRISAPLNQYYYTAMYGDATNLPVLKATAGFKGMAVIDSDPYAEGGINWFTNQNNFFRQIRNFRIDITEMPITGGAGIHWQVAQATSLQNIVFDMVKGGTGNAQVGIFMDNGSGGFMADLVFNGGQYGAFFGNQQFTTRNLTFNDCQTAIFMNWNWLWTLKSLSINNCQTGINMSASGPVETVGSVIVQDSVFTNTPTGVITSYVEGSTFSNGTLLIDNCDFSGSTNAIVDASGAPVLAGGSKVASWGQGHAYTTASGVTASNSTKRAEGLIQIRGPLAAPAKPSGLLTSSGTIFERSKPSYETVPASSFLSVKSAGAKGDGKTDDTAVIQALLDKATKDQIVYFDHGAYLVTDTIKIPKNIKIVGEFWPLIMADGKSFNDVTNPKPVFQVGAPGDVGDVELIDLMLETVGPAPGAIMIEWNVAGTSQGSAGMWDVHTRIGGSAGTGLQSDTCAKNPNVTADANPDCMGAFMLLHITKTGSAYLENNWFWVADHELDLDDYNQINIYNGRGVYIESQSPVWMYGTSSEHNQLYNYQFVNAQNVYMGCIQVETPYMQGNPDALQPFKPDEKWNDPTFSTCTTPSCKKTWGLRIVSSSNILIYGAGLYSFFENYGQTCIPGKTCQENMVSIEKCSGSNYIWGLTTIGTTNMVVVDDKPFVPAAENIAVFGDTIAVFDCA